MAGNARIRQIWTMEKKLHSIGSTPLCGSDPITHTTERGKRSTHRYRLTLGGEFLHWRLLPGWRLLLESLSNPSPSKWLERDSRSVSLSINRGRPIQDAPLLIWKLKVSISGEIAARDELQPKQFIPVAAHTGRRILQPVWRLAGSATGI